MTIDANAVDAAAERLAGVVTRTPLQINERLDRRSAIEMSARIRLRPILMTTAAMVTGLIPLLTATGAGAASRFSIGLVVVAGMSIGTLFTLFVLPAVYVVLATDHDRFDYGLIESAARLIVDSRGKYRTPARHIIKA